MIPMTTTNRPEVRHGTIRWPNGGNPTARWQAAERAAWKEAQSTLADGEQVVDLRLETGAAERGNDSVMVYSYSYQVIKPGTTQWSTRLR